MHSYVLQEQSVTWYHQLTDCVTLYLNCVGEKVELIYEVVLSVLTCLKINSIDSVSPRRRRFQVLIKTETNFVLVRIQNSSQMKPTSDTIHWKTWDAQNPACIINALKPSFSFGWMIIHDSLIWVQFIQTESARFHAVLLISNEHSASMLSSSWPVMYKLLSFTPAASSLRLVWGIIAALWRHSTVLGMIHFLTIISAAVIVDYAHWWRCWGCGHGL